MSKGKDEAFEKAYASVVENGWENVKHMARQVWDMASATHPAAQVQGEREGFEAWQRSGGFKRPDDPGEWEAWQARAALSAPPAAGVAEGLRKAAEWHRKQREAFERQMHDDEANYRAAVSEELPKARIDALMARWQSSSCSAANHNDYAAELTRQADAIAPTPPASEKQHDGRMPSDARNRMWGLIDVALLDTVPDGLKRGDICNTLAPLLASEQHQAVVMPERCTEHAGDRDNLQWARGANWMRERFLHLNPHLQPAAPADWCKTMERPKSKCGCPDCGSSLVQVDGLPAAPSQGGE